MGQVIGWKCKGCGCGEEFVCGSGMMAPDREAIARDAREGRFGAAARALLGGGIPGGWDIHCESAFYACPECGGIIAGRTVSVADGSGNWVVLHEDPGTCPDCGAGVSFWDERIPVRETELAQRCERRLADGCPKCGGTDVELVVADWD